MGSAEVAKRRAGSGRLARHVRVIDVAPTVCYLTGAPMLRNVEGGVIYEAVEDADLHRSSP